MGNKEDILVIETAANPTHSIIWLHGLGADKHDFEPIIPQLGLEDSPAIRFIFPNAPVRPITVNGGMPMRGWYDVRSMLINQEEDGSGIRESADYISTLIAAEMKRGIPASRIILAGFSQGGAIALFLGTRHSPPLAGIIALSGYLPLINSLDSEAIDQLPRIPVFIGHGTEDDIVPVELGAFTRDTLVKKGVDVEFALYPMSHSVSNQEILDLGKWISRVLPRMER
jgi:phospholipase/carboxylesterase